MRDDYEEFGLLGGVLVGVVVGLGGWLVVRWCLEAFAGNYGPLLLLAAICFGFGLILYGISVFPRGGDR